MSSANYIPLTQISPSEYLASPKASPHVSLSSYISRRRTVLGLIALTSLITLAVFIRFTVLGDDDDYDDYIFNINPNYEPSYIAIPISDASPSPARPQLRPVRELPTSCLERYYASGLPCHDGQGPVPIDIVWTWVNGSDPLFYAARMDAANSYGPDDPYGPIQTNNPSRMFRDHDELRHSMRSVLANFRPYTNRFHLLTSDFDYPEEDIMPSPFPHPGPGYWRLGLQPQWLDTGGNEATEWRDGDVHLSLTHHAHFFNPYNHSIFNSYAIETQFSHLHDLSEIFIYMNDDFFMTSPLTPTTFYTHQYGLVLRLQKSLSVSPDWPSQESRGEWRTMGVSNYLLSERFGRRYRPYVQHEAKTASYAMLQEIELIWPEYIAKTATHAFRETVGGDGDFYEMFVHAHYVVERAREALLWSWVVGRMGGMDDGWGEKEMHRAWLELGGAGEGRRAYEIYVDSSERDTLDPERITEYLKESGIEGHFRTNYQFSSLDGYAYNEFGRQGEGSWPTFQKRHSEGGDDEDSSDEDSEDAQLKKRAELRSCTISRSECFDHVGADGEAPTASEIFKHIAFEKPQCGDCMIVSLLAASGPLGLSAFLPHSDRISPPSSAEPADDSDLIPHLPLVANWRDGQFALRDVMKYAPESSVRVWTMRVLQRYRYVVGGTASMFEQLITFSQARSMLKSVDRNKELALLCVNDDVTQDDAEIAGYFRMWQDKKWGTPAAWESHLDGR